jgi:hypothetical protein
MGEDGHAAQSRAVAASHEDPTRNVERRQGIGCPSAKRCVVLRQKFVRRQMIEQMGLIRRKPVMVALLLRLFELLSLFFGAQGHVALEILVLRHQLAVYKRMVGESYSDRLNG